MRESGLPKRRERRGRGWWGGGGGGIGGGGRGVVGDWVVVHVGGHVQR